MNRCPKKYFFYNLFKHSKGVFVLSFLPLILSRVSSVAWEEGGKDELHVVGCVYQRTVGLYY